MDSALRNEMVELAHEACVGLDAAAYCLPRFDRYPGVIWTRDEVGRLAAFLLYDRFVEGGATHVYLGPLFSRGGAFVPMFVREVRRLLRTETGPVHLLCEAQNPAVVDAFRMVFPWDAHPRRDRRAPSIDVVRTVERFKRRISHMGPVDLTTFTTGSAETLCRARGDASVVETLRGRGVDLARGRNLLLLASCAATPLARARMQLGLTVGLAAINARRGAQRRAA